MSLLFPREPRTFAGRRAIKVVLRALHVLCAGLLVGAYAFDVPIDILRDEQLLWLWATLGTGTLILLLDLHESGVFLLEVRGLVVAGKLLLVAALPWSAPHEAWLLASVVLISVVSSHAPGSIRHRLVFGRGRFRSSESKG